MFVKMKRNMAVLLTLLVSVVLATLVFAQQGYEAADQDEAEPPLVDGVSDLRTGFVESIDVGNWVVVLDGNKYMLSSRQDEILADTVAVAYPDLVNQNLLLEQLKVGDRVSYVVDMIGFSGNNETTVLILRRKK